MIPHDTVGADVQRIVQSVVRQYGLGVRVGRVSACDQTWRIELCDPFRGDTTIAVQGTDPHRVRRAVMGALDVDE